MTSVGQNELNVCVCVCVCVCVGGGEYVKKNGDKKYLL